MAVVFALLAFGLGAVAGKLLSDRGERLWRAYALRLRAASIEAGLPVPESPDG